MTLVRPEYMSSWDDDYRRHRSAVIAAGGPVTGKAGRNAIVNSWNRELYATGVRTRTPKGGSPAIDVGAQNVA